VPNTPDAVLAVPCPACRTRAGLQCTIEPRAWMTPGEDAFDLKMWSHVTRIDASRALVVAEPRTFS
jgi:hypothetical protein